MTLSFIGNALPYSCTIQDIQNELAKYKACWWFGLVDFWTDEKPKSVPIKPNRSKRNPKRRHAQTNTRLPAPLPPHDDRTDEPIEPTDYHAASENLATMLGYTLLRENIAGRHDAIQGWYLVKPSQSPQYLGNDIQTIYEYLSAVYNSHQ